MRPTTKALLSNARNEKDVENAYRGELSHHRPDAKVTSPFGSDGYAEWPKDVRALLEFKYDLALKSRAVQCGVLGQMLGYLKRFEQVGQVMPNVLFVGDKNECFALEVEAVKEFLSLSIDWSKAPSTGNPTLVKALVDRLDVSPYVFDVGEDLDFKDVLSKIETLARGEVHRVRATGSNIGAMFMFWRDNIFLPTSGLTAVEQVDVFLRCLFKPDDVALHGANKNLLVVEGRKIPVNGHQWQSFINHFVRGYKPSEIEGFYANKDRLVEDDARRRQGAFFTPTLWVDEAHRMLDAELGLTWRDDCIVWDPAAGTGNLTRDYRFKDLIISTAEKPDVDVIIGQDYNPGASVFAYDFLNDDSSPFFDGKNVIPDAVADRLYAAAKAGKRLVFLMNPPYAEDGVLGATGNTKKGVAATATAQQMRKQQGRAARQLYTQFMYRCAKLAERYGFTKTTVATFSIPTFMVSGSYKGFRDFWYGKYAYRMGMLFQASHFADVSGAWGISFTMWSEGKTDHKTDLPIALKDVADFGTMVVTTAGKLLYNSDGRSASDWIPKGPKGLGDTPKFSSGLKIQDGYEAGSCNGSLWVFCNMGNNVMKSGTDVYILSGKPTHKGCCHVDILPGESFRRAVALYAARKLVTNTWVNHVDEYLAPNMATPAYKQWNDDAIIYAMLEGKNNCTAMRNVKYKGLNYRIKNHFWWKTRKESLQVYDTPGCSDIYKDAKQESEDAYLATILPTLDLSPEAKACLTALNACLATTLPHRESFATARPELHLTAHDAGVYQLKHLFREHDPEGWKALQAAFKALADKLRPGVYEHGFLKP